MLINHVTKVYIKLSKEKQENSNVHFLNQSFDPFSFWFGFLLKNYIRRLEIIQCPLASLDSVSAGFMSCKTG